MEKIKIIPADIYKMQKELQRIDYKVTTMGGSILGIPASNEATGLLDREGNPIKAGDIIKDKYGFIFGICYYCYRRRKPYPYGIFFISKDDDQIHYFWGGFIVIKDKDFCDLEDPIIIGNIKENIGLLMR